MKKTIVLLITIFILVTAFAPVSLAASDASQNSADALNHIGLFLGTDLGYELDRELTRAEAVTMIVRVVGGEKDALANNYEHPFTDVPSWAHPYVGYAYKYGITMGISATEFGTTGKLKPNEYLTFMLRVLGYVDVTDGTPDFKWDSPYELAANVGIVAQGYSATAPIKRGEVTEMSWKLLSCTYKEQVNRVFSALAAKDVFSLSSYDEAKIIASVGIADFTEQIKKSEFTVFFRDMNAEILKTDTVVRGADATPPDAPAVDGYTFVEWTPDYTNVNSDLNIVAVYEKNLDGGINVGKDTEGSDYGEFVPIY